MTGETPNVIDMTPQEPPLAEFGIILRYVRSGYKVRRKSWIQGQYLTTEEGEIRFVKDVEDTPLVNVLWVPTQDDILAMDWHPVVPL